LKKLLLVAGGKNGTLLLAPLYEAFKKNSSYKTAVLLAATEGTEPISRDLAVSFNIGGEGIHTISLLKGTPIQQLAAVMTSLEAILLSEQPDIVLVCGSDNVAFGATVTAAKLGLPVAAVDAGLRSYDRSDSEEINRMVIDAMADIHFVSEHSGEYNLINEGVPDEKVFYCGNLTIDTLVRLMEQRNKEVISDNHDLLPKKYMLVLLNPAMLSTGKKQFEMILRLLKEISSQITIVMLSFAGFERLIKEHELNEIFLEIENLEVIEQPAHTVLLTLLRDSRLLLTDTEELQAEATVMNVPCLTMMETSTRPSTIEIGTNILVGLNEDDIRSSIYSILDSDLHHHVTSRSKIPEKWDGTSADRIVALLEQLV